MKISLFSQSLYALELFDAIDATAKIGIEAIEIACCRPHFDITMARGNPEAVAERVKKAGLKVSALSLSNNFTAPETLEQQIKDAEVFMRLAPLFDTKLLKLTPGPPGSSEATEQNWNFLSEAVKTLTPVAQTLGLKLAFETHMKQLTDTLASSKRLLEMADETVGLTVDFSNLAFAGEKMAEVFTRLANRIYHTHIKNGYIDSQGGWHFGPLNEGMTDYAEVISLLKKINYTGYLSLECLGTDAKEKPIETVQRDLKILRGYLEKQN